MDNKPIYHYTEEELRDFWFYNGGDHIFQTCYALPEPILNILIEIEPSKCLPMLWNLLSQEIDDIYEIHNILFWVNMFFVCTRNTWLYPNSSSQWYFNTPKHPFEIYLAKKSLINVYETYEIDYPK